MPESPKTETISTRRVKTFLVKPQDMLFLFTKGLKLAKRTEVFEGMPEDAELVGIVYDTRLDHILMVVKSMEFEPIPTNAYPPMGFIKFRIGVEGATKKKKK